MLLALATAAVVSVSVGPEQPYLEQAGPVLHLNCDFILRNTGAETLRLDEVEASVYDAGGALMQRRFISPNGTSPSISTIAAREIPAQDFIVVFNPFESWSPDVLPNRMRYRFVLRPVKQEAGPQAAATDAEVSFTPRAWVGKTRLVPPLKGRFLVWDGHDFYSHHRRWDIAHPILKKMGLRHNPARYAYDLSLVDEGGAMYRGTGAQPEDWFGFGAPIVAAAGGRVVAARNDAPDRGPDKVDWDQVPANPMLIAGNYLIVDHGHGEHSAFFHLQQGSVEARPGDVVKAGQLIARMGFSGDAFTVHLHYQLQAGAAFDVEGLPSVFHDYTRVLGSRRVRVERGTIDTGDIVER
jgi:murein DD-endopeptidase MepM/ murein hydrolase activator NlpD